MFEFNEWGTAKAGIGYGGDINGRWCSIMETKKGHYRGNHTHPNDQYTLLLTGKIKIVKLIEGEFKETLLKQDKAYKSEAGIPHITIALEDSVSFEWWDGLSSMQACPEAFTKYVEELEK
jgi:hypothetical protein